MAELLQEINTIIQTGTTQAGSTHATWPVYAGGLPDSTFIGDRAVGLLHGPGMPDMGSDSSGSIWMERPNVQVLVRGLPINQYSTSYPEAIAVAQAVKNALHGFGGLSSAGGSFYTGIWAENGPAFIGYDQAGRPIFSSNFRVYRSKS